jgi:hypothetical protein
VISNCEKNSNTEDAKKKLETKAKTKRKGRGPPPKERPLKRVFRVRAKDRRARRAQCRGRQAEHIYEDKGVTCSCARSLNKRHRNWPLLTRSAFQADLDTAETEVKLWKTRRRGAKKNLGAAEEERHTRPEAESKSSELKAGGGRRLIQSKARIVTPQKRRSWKGGSISSATSSCW